MEQQVSWTKAGGIPAHPGLVGQVYFPTDSDRLDDQDKKVLDTLAREYGILLLRNRIELTFLGHADKRGSKGYNKALGLRRARAVRSYMDGLLGSGNFNHYSSKNALSKGEEEAAQGQVSAERMAEDRRVDIVSSFIPRKHFRLPPLKIEGAVPARRIVYREFRSSSGKDISDLTKPDPLGENLDKLLKHWISSGESLYGSEVMGSRRVSQFPMTYRVNSLRISIEQTTRSGIGYEAQAANTYITYTWGPPRDIVQVTWATKSKSIVFGRESVEQKSRTKSYRREKLQGNSIYFPPDPR